MSAPLIRFYPRRLDAADIGHAESLVDLVGKRGGLSGMVVGWVYTLFETSPIKQRKLGIFQCLDGHLGDRHQKWCLIKPIWRLNTKFSGINSQLKT